ncbi:hypothetical protein [Frigidibacter sp. MR17.24]|uniref:hypothetical protein n=1 Tax=Frigidibacter sp. MR17.24 TaxID=3127345 RepID=UPI003012B3D6
MKRDGLKLGTTGARGALRVGLLVALSGSAALAQVIAIDPPRPNDRPEDLRLIAPDATHRAVEHTPRPQIRPDNPLELALPSIEEVAAQADAEPAGATGHATSHEAEPAAGIPVRVKAPGPAFHAAPTHDAPQAEGHATPQATDAPPAHGPAHGPTPTHEDTTAHGDAPAHGDTTAHEAAPHGTAEPVAPAASGHGTAPQTLAEEAPQGTPGTAPQPVTAAPPIAPPPLALGQYRAASFLRDRARLSAAYAAATGDAARDAAAMDLATLYLAHQMRPEGRSILAALSPAAMQPATAARLGALQTAFRLMDGETVPADTPALAEGPGAWADRPLWAALAGYRAGDHALVAATLPGAIEMIDHQPTPFTDEVLLPLLDAAIEAGQWNLSGALAERIAARPGLRDAPGYNLLLGKASAASGQPEAAFDAYARAASGQGADAQRARLALADLGIAAGGTSLRQTAEMLTSVRYDWRGGPLELGLLDRLARVEQRIGNAPAALRWYGQILTLFPDTPEAAHAQEETGALLNRVYTDGGAGRIEIGTFLRLHRNIAPDFLRMEGFDLQARKLGQRLLALGATAAAAEEFAAIRGGLAEGATAGLWEVSAERETSARLDEAEALIAGGQVPAALALLAPAQAGRIAPETEQRLAQLRVEALWASGALDELSREPLSSDPGTTELRRIADARFDRSDWAKAAELYRALWHDHPRDFGFADAARLFLSAHRSGDGVVASTVAQAFPDLASDAGWKTVAETILATPEPIVPLRDEAIERRMSRTEQAVTQLRDLQTVAATGAEGTGGTPSQ